ncbi:MAG: hypothetical protein DIU84_01735, partial [Bacillota bacterium]
MASADVPAGPAGRGVDAWDDGFHPGRLSLAQLYHLADTLPEDRRPRFIALLEEDRRRVARRCLER